MSRAVDAEAVGFERDWLAGFDDPVVRAKGNNRTMHAPDLDADEPAPECNAGQEGTEWVVAERAALEPIFHDCGNDDCEDAFSGPLADDDEAIIEILDGEWEATERELVETFHAADGKAANGHVLAALAEVRRGDGA